MPFQAFQASALAAAGTLPLLTGPSTPVALIEPVRSPCRTHEALVVKVLLRLRMSMYMPVPGCAAFAGKG